MILSAAASIEIHKQQINELNVFPVPDGDTGTNMSMTLNAAAADLRKAGSVTLTKAADITASAMLRGAHGNSGVILSLLFRGLSKGLKGVESADAATFSAAMQEGVLAADGDVGQILALCEGTRADLRHAGGNVDLLQVVVVVKRIFADGFQALRQDDLAQLKVGLR